MKEALFH